MSYMGFTTHALDIFTSVIGSELVIWRAHIMRSNSRRKDYVKCLIISTFAAF